MGGNWGRVVGLEGDGDDTECAGKIFGPSDGRLRCNPGTGEDTLGEKEQARERSEGPELGGTYIGDDVGRRSFDRVTVGGAVYWRWGAKLAAGRRARERGTSGGGGGDSWGAGEGLTDVATAVETMGWI